MNRKFYVFFFIFFLLIVAYASWKLNNWLLNSLFL